MRDKDLYVQILGIKSPWHLSGVELNMAGGEVAVQVEQVKYAKQYDYVMIVSDQEAGWERWLSWAVGSRISPIKKLLKSSRSAYG